MSAGRCQNLGVRPQETAWSAMRYPQPVHDSITAKKAALDATLRASEEETRRVKKKLREFQRLSKRVDNALELQDVKMQLQERDLSGVIPMRGDLEVKLQQLTKASSVNKARHDAACTALEDLGEEIRGRTDEVNQQTESLKEAAYLWQAANNIVIDNCQRAAFHGYDKLQRWAQTAPVLNTWLNTEGQLQRSIYASSWVLGVNTEVAAQGEVRKLLQDFEDAHYSKLSQIPSSQLPTMKQAQDQRQARSEAFDQVHWKLLKQLRLMVKQCDYLQLEIESREHIRARLKALTMEIHSALEEDCLDAVGRMSGEAQRAIEGIVQVLQALPVPERQNTVLAQFTTLSRITPTALNGAAISAGGEALASQEEGVSTSKLSSLEGSLLMSSISDDEASDIVRNDLKYMSAQHIQQLALANGGPAIGGDDETLRMRAKLDKLLSVPPIPNRTKKVIRSQTQDLPRNLDRINIKLKGLHEALKKVTLDSTDTLHVPGSQRDNNGKDPVYELLAAKKAARRMQACCAHAVHDSILASMQHTEVDITASLTEEASARASVEGRERMRESFRSSRSELEGWMEQAILDKYRMGVVMLKAELGKSNLVPDVEVPTTASTSRRGTAARGAQAELAGGSRSQAPSLAQSAGDVELAALGVTHRLIGFSTRKSASFAANEPSFDESDMQLGTAELLNTINKQMSSEALDVVATTATTTVDPLAADPTRADSALSEDADMNLEMIVDGDRFQVNFLLKPRSHEAVMVARKHITKNERREFLMSIPLDCFVSLTGTTDVDVLQQQLAHDRHKFYQAVRPFFHIEHIPAQFYDQLKESRTPRPRDMEDMLSAPVAVDAPLPEDLPDPHALKVLTLRSKTGALLRFALSVKHIKTN